MDNRLWTEFDSCRAYLKMALASACNHEPRDLDAELQALWRESFTWAATHDKARQVSFAEVEACDLRAMGHVDWSSKLPLYVAEKMYTT